MSNVLLFGDQTAEQYPLLRKIVLRNHNHEITSFLERSSAMLRAEIGKLPRSQRVLFPDFLRVSNLVELYYENGLKIPQVESALLTIAQLGHYIAFFSENPTQLPASANTRAIALCSGSLAAAAIVSAKTTADLVPLAVEAVRVAFRVGSIVGAAKQALDQNATDSWSTIVTGTSEEAAKEALAAFHETNQIPLSTQAYISAVSTMAITISGPPSTTKRLFQESEALRKNNRVPIPVFGPYHGAHLYTDADIERVFDAELNEILKSHQPRSLVHSASTGKCFVANDTLELFHLAIADMLQKPVRWDYLLEETVSQVTANTKAPATVFSMGISNVANSLVSALKAGGQSSVTVVDQSSFLNVVDGPTQGRTQNDKIAIVGLAGRFPSAASHEALWELLEKGLDVHRKVPADRFDADAHCDPSGKGKNKSHTPFGCFIDEPGLFDPKFFNMSPREAAQTDPMGRLALVTAYEALEMSGYVPNRTPSTKLHRIGTFYGQTSDDWREINAAENVDTYYITGGVRAFAPGRINYYFKFSGPSFSIDTACSSSLAAIQLACTSLWAGDCDTACAGGLNVLTNPDIFSGLSKGQFLSKTGSCKTYDNNADGYCRGDGAGTVILKRYEDAIADKDNILGSILNAATNHSAEAVSITHPHAGAQEFLFKKVLADAGIDAHEISYVEMHGTGTQAGDGIEMTSVTNTFAPRHRRRTPEQKLHLGAIKANIGHGEAASGINSLAKILMMFRKDAIPANVGIKTEINRSFPKDLKERNVHIPQQNVHWPRNGAEKRKIFLNNFSAAGGNTSLLIEDGPLREAPKGVDPRGTLPVTVTGRSIASLKRNIANLQKYLAENPATTLPSMSYTTTARRIQHNYRVAFPIADIAKVSDALQAQVKESYSPVPMVSSKTAFCFTGQGSQYTALGKKLYEDLQTFRDDIDQLNKLAVVQGLPSFLELLDGTDVQTLSPVKVQLGMACIQVALANMWASWGITPVAVIGHSLGEYAALHVAGVISASDMVLLVGRRAELLVKDCTPHTHGMLAVKGSADAIRGALGAKMTEIACINGPEETVLCGSIEVVGAANETLASRGFKATKLNVPFAFHSAQVDPILESFKRIASSVVFNKPTVPVLSPLSGDVIREAGIIGPDYLASHARETVDFWTALTSAQKEKVFDEKTAWLEVGAHPVCSGMVKASVGANVAAPSLRRGEDPWKTLSTTICALFTAGVAFNFDEFHRSFNDAHELLELPTYSFDSKKYWLDYHNNWTLTKGEVHAPKAIEAPKEAAPVAAPKSYKRLSDSCHKVIEEEFTANTAKVIIQSDVTEPKLRALTIGHQVNNTALCPSSLYADMALTVADYMYKGLRPSAPKIGYNVANMEVPKTFIVKFDAPAEGQHLQLQAEADLEEGVAHLKWLSVTPEGKKIEEKAHCIVKYEEISGWKENWDTINFMVKAQVDILKQKTKTRDAHVIQRGMAYKMFKGFVDYGNTYRGMEEVILDNKTTEGSSSVQFQTKPEDGDFYFPGYWIDSMCHLGGFIVNASDLFDSDNFVYVSHGWGSIKIAKDMSADKKYRNYVRMQDKPGNMSVGDVYIMDEDDEIVAVCGGLKFQQIPRKVLNIFLPPQAKNVAGAVKAPLAASPKPAAISTKSVPAPIKTQIAAPVKAAVKAPAKAPKKAAVAKKPQGATITSRVMTIVATETEVDMTELVDEAAFENLGVDSLLSLTISARFREDLDLEISSTLFTDYPTIGEMKKFFAQYDGAAPAVDDDDSSESDSEPSTDVATPYEEEVGTPASSAPSSAASIAGKDSSRDDIEVGEVSLARHIVAQEMGVDISEITDAADLAEMGMDSLMSLAILGELREKTGVDLPSTFLVTNGTIEEIENALGMRPKPKAKAAPAPSAEKRYKEPQLDKVNAKLIDISKMPPATSVLLQGNAKIASKKIFFLPDGSGSATSYVSIPNIGPDVAAFGLNCPFMKDPTSWTCGIDAVALLYLNEIKRRQPHGPYIIGGWSAGGVIAYAVAQALLANGEEVEKLLLLDSPCPVNLDPLPARLHVFFNEIGLLGTGDPSKTPKWLLPHFTAAIRSLSDYEPKKLLKPVKTYAIWCREGVAGNAGDPRPPPAEDEDPAPMKWLLNHRTDFSDNGWAQLCGAENMSYGVMDGNHFSMMKAPHAESLGRLIQEGLKN